MQKSMDYMIKELKNSGLTVYQKKVLAGLSLIPTGEISTYGDLAAFTGNGKASRAVGGVMNINPFSPELPCHRVLSSDGGIGGFSSGTAKKRKMLAREGISFSKGKMNQFSEKRHIFNLKDKNELKKLVKMIK